MCSYIFAHCFIFYVIWIGGFFCQQECFCKGALPSCPVKVPCWRAACKGCWPGLLPRAPWTRAAGKTKSPIWIVLAWIWMDVWNLFGKTHIFEKILHFDADMGTFFVIPWRIVFSFSFNILSIFSNPKYIFKMSDDMVNLKD